jgi:hypothetical protein
MAIPALTSRTIFPIDGTVYVDFTQVDDTSVFNPAQGEISTNKGRALYCLVGTGGVAAGDLVEISTAASTGIRTATKQDSTSSGSTPKKDAVAVATATAAKYAWFLFGDLNQVPVNVANSVASGAALTTTGTAGQAGAGGDTIVGLYTNEASGASGLTSCSSVGSIGTNI